MGLRDWRRRQVGMIRCSWMKAVIQIKWRVVSRTRFMIVDGELYQWEEFIPIRLMIVRVNSENLFHCPIRSLSLSVGLGMERGTHGESRIQEFVKRAPEVTGKTCVAVRNNVQRKTVIFENAMKELLCDRFSIVRGLARV